MKSRREVLTAGIGVIVGYAAKTLEYHAPTDKAQAIQKTTADECHVVLDAKDSIDLLSQHVDELVSKVKDLPRLALPAAEVHALIVENMAALKGVAEILREQKMKLSPPGTPAHDLGVLAWQVPADSEAQHAYKCAKDRTRVFCGYLNKAEDKIWIHQLFLRAEGSLQQAIFFEAVRPELALSEGWMSMISLRVFPTSSTHI
jgi:hypothetical protein